VAPTQDADQLLPLKMQRGHSVERRTPASPPECARPDLVVGKVGGVTEWQSELSVPVYAVAILTALRDGILLDRGSPSSC
jgi:hypothetical protein